MSACPSLEEHELAANKQLAATATVAFVQHLAACAACKVRYARVRRDERDGRALRKNFGLQFGNDSTVRLADAEALLDRTALDELHIPGYIVGRRIGSGEQGTVYEALELSTKRQRALKVLHGGYFAGKEARGRFQREIEIAARLKHHNIAMVHHAGEVGGYLYCAMDYVDGVRLDKSLKEKQPPLQTRLELFATLCDAITYAHAHGVIHRDLKPSNVLVDANGAPHVVDFGFARSLDQPSMAGLVSMGGYGVGALGYMSPEQTLGQPEGANISTDIYSLGAILYRMLTGRLPIEASPDIAITLRRIQTVPPPRPSSFVAGLDRRLDAIVLMALAKAPSERYRNTAEFADDIRNYLARGPLIAIRQTPAQKAWRFVRNHRISVAATICVFVLLATGLAFSSWSLRQMRWQRYLAEIQAAHGEIRLTNVPAAKRHLEAGVPRNMQGTWEWRYLHSGLDDSSQVVALPGNALPSCMTRSPDGHMLAIGDEGGRIHLFDVATLHFVNGLLDMKHAQLVRALSFDPTGKWLVSACDDRTIGIWEVSSGKRLKTLSCTREPTETTTQFLPTDSVLSLTVSPDGQWIAGGYSDGDLARGRVIVWRWGSSMPEQIPEAPMASASTVQSLLDSEHFVSTDEWGRVRRWRYDGNVSEVLATPHTVHHGASVTVLMPGGNELLSAARDGWVKLIDLQSGDVKWAIHAHSECIDGLAVSHDRRLIATGARDRSIRLWSMDDQQLVRELRGHTANVVGVAFKNDGQQLVSLGRDRTVRVWPVDSADQFVTDQQKLMASTPSPDGRNMVTLGQKHHVRVWNLATHSVIWEKAIESDLYFMRAAWSPDGAQIAVGSRSDRETSRSSIVTVFDAATGAETHCLPGHGLDSVTGIAFLPGRDGLLTSDDAGRIRRLRFDDPDQAVFQPAHAHSISALAVSYTRGVVALGDLAGGLSLWGMDDGQFRWRRQLDDGEGIAALAFDAPGGRLAAGTNAGTVFILNTRGGRQIGAQFHHSRAVRAVGFSPDGSRLATGSDDHGVRLWHLDRATELLCFRGHASQLISLGFLPPCGNTLVSVSAEDCAVHLWGTTDSVMSFDR